MPREYRTKEQRDIDLALERIAGMAELARQVDPGVMSCATATSSHSAGPERLLRRSHPRSAVAASMSFGLFRSCPAIS
jgi:hypothetical protein